MSYCGWSNDFGMCDVYVYEDVSGGWTTHVAGRRIKHKPPAELVAMPCTNGEEFIERYKAERAWRRSLPGKPFKTAEIMVGGEPKPGTGGWEIDDSEYIDLPGPYAGESFNDPTPGTCADRLEEIRASGLNVPQYAIDALREEQAEL